MNETNPNQPGIPKHRRPSVVALWMLLFLVVIILAGSFVAGYLPRWKRDRTVNAESKASASQALAVNVSRARMAAPIVELELPGSVQPLTEAPILARTDGYLKRRLVDIGDRVTTGQLLAELEAPELEQQVQQAQAAVLQARANLEQSRASLEQGKANQQLARLTAERWRNLLAKGAVSRQENDQYQAQYSAQTANVQALEKSVLAAQSGVAAAEANVSRLQQLQTYRNVVAPFSGVVTLRNVDVGALITAGQTLLFRVAQTSSLRVYINVPQANAGQIKPGQRAELAVSEFPGRRFGGVVVRSANALDPTSRTLLAEVQVANPGGVLMPGMYALVKLTSQRDNPPALIPGDTMVLRSQGPQVAVVEDGHIRFRIVRIGRDFGNEIEILSGVRPGDLLVVNPNDAVQEGVAVRASELRRTAEQKAAK